MSEYGQMNSLLRDLHAQRNHTTQKTFKFSNFDVDISEQNGKEIGSHVWAGGQCLARYLDEHMRQALPGSSVLELGCGCGLSGIAAAKLGATVVLSDRADMQALVDANIEKNAKIVTRTLSSTSEERLPCRFHALNWDDAESAAQLGKEFDFVIASDVVYAPQHFASLIQTILAVTAPHSRFILAHRPRPGDQQFFKDIGEYFDMPELTRYFPESGPSIVIMDMERKNPAVGLKTGGPPFSRMLKIDPPQQGEKAMHDSYDVTKRMMLDAHRSRTETEAAETTS